MGSPTNEKMKAHSNARAKNSTVTLMLTLTFVRSAANEKRSATIRAAKGKQAKNIARPNATLSKLSMCSLAGCEPLNGRERDNDYHTSSQRVYATDVERARVRERIAHKAKCQKTCVKYILIN